MLNATGHDHESFRMLLDVFKPVYDLYMWDEKTQCIRLKRVDGNGEPRGKVHDLTACGCLGLVLMWYRTRGSCARSLALLFGADFNTNVKMVEVWKESVVVHIE